MLGAGLLVGTALTVIIPEGIRSLYLYGGGGSVKLPTSDGLTSVKPLNSLNRLTLDEELQSGKDLHGDFKHKFEDHSGIIGLSLALGFTFMMLIDQLVQRRQNSSSNNTNERKITATLGLVVHAAGMLCEKSPNNNYLSIVLIYFDCLNCSGRYSFRSCRHHKSPRCRNNCIFGNNVA